MKKIVTMWALAFATLLSACGPNITYGSCLASHEEDHPPYTSYEPTVGGMSMSGGMAMPGSGSGGYRLVMHAGYTETVCDQWEFPEGREVKPDA